MSDTEHEVYFDVEYFRQRDFDVSSHKIRDYVNDKPRYGLKVYVDKYDFGDIPQNQQSLAYTFPILNFGFDDIENFEVKIIGDFVINSEIPKIIKANEFIQISVFCKPKQLGKISGALYVESFYAIGNSIINLSAKCV